MADNNTLLHKFVSAKDESPDPTLVSVNEWNQEHVFSGGVNGQVLIYDDTMTDNVSWTSGPVINIAGPPYNAILNGVFDNADILENALNTVNGAIFIPYGVLGVRRNVFCSKDNIYMFGVGVGSVIKALTGFVNTANKGAVSFGFVNGTGVVPFSNLVVHSVAFDGSALCRPLDVYGCTNGMLRELYVHGSSTGVLGIFDSTDVTVQQCRIEGGVGLFGDGLYFGGCVRPRALYNKVYDFTRIGIVTEADIASTGNTINPVIRGNHVSYAHDATSTENNAGIWLENTDGGDISYNILENLTNTPNPASGEGFGIVIAGGSSNGHRFSCMGNAISGATTGVRINIEPTDSAIVKNTTINRGTIANFRRGVHFITGHVLVVDGVGTTGNTFSDGLHGVIVIDLTSANATHHVHILNMTSGDGVPTDFSNVDAADVNIVALSSALTNLYIVNGAGIKVSMRAAPRRVFVDNSVILVQGQNYPSLWATEILSVVGGRLIQSTSYLGNGVKAIAGVGTGGSSPSVYTFSGVVFERVQAVINNDGVGEHLLKFDGCTFLSSTGLTIDGRFTVEIDNSYWNGWKSTGAIVGDHTDWDLLLRGVVFNNLGDASIAEPVRANAGCDATVFTVSDVIYSSTNLYSAPMTPVTTGYTRIVSAP